MTSAASTDTRTLFWASRSWKATSTDEVVSVVKSVVVALPVDEQFAAILGDLTMLSTQAAALLRSALSQPIDVDGALSAVLSARCLHAVCTQLSALSANPPSAWRHAGPHEPHQAHPWRMNCDC